MGEVVNFVDCFVEYSFLFHWFKRYKKRRRKARVIIKNKVARFYGSRCILALSLYVALSVVVKHCNPSDAQANTRGFQTAVDEWRVFHC